MNGRVNGRDVGIADMSLGSGSNVARADLLTSSLSDPLARRLGVRRRHVLSGFLAFDKRKCRIPRSCVPYFLCRMSGISWGSKSTR